MPPAQLCEDLWEERGGPRRGLPCPRARALHPQLGEAVRCLGDRADHGGLQQRGAHRNPRGRFNPHSLVPAGRGLLQHVCCPPARQHRAPGCPGRLPPRRQTKNALRSRGRVLTFAREVGSSGKIRTYNPPVNRHTARFSYRVALSRTRSITQGVTRLSERSQGRLKSYGRRS